MSTEDLLDHYRLEAEVFPDHTVHTSTKRNRRGLREQVKIKWDRKETLGQGMFGHVWKEERQQHPDKSRDVRAVKMVHKNRIKGFDFKREILALAKLDKNEYREAEIFALFLGWFETTESVFLAMEYFRHGDLSLYILDISGEDEVRQITSDLLAGLATMHAEGFAHRDLKPQNCFVFERPPESNRWWVKLGDFGISKRIRNEDTMLRTETGTPYFQAPEIQGFIEELEETSIYSQAVDLWSLGCIVYNLLAKKVPFPNRQVLNRFCRGRSPFPIERLSSRTSEGGVSFTLRLLSPKPTDRISAEAALSHPWIIDTSSEPDIRETPVPSEVSTAGPAELARPTDHISEATAIATATATTLPNDNPDKRHYQVGDVSIFYSKGYLACACGAQFESPISELRRAKKSLERHIHEEKLGAISAVFGDQIYEVGNDHTSTGSLDDSGDESDGPFFLPTVSRWSQLTNEEVGTDRQRKPTLEAPQSALENSEVAKHVISPPKESEASRDLMKAAAGTAIDPTDLSLRNEHGRERIRSYDRQDTNSLSDQVFRTLSDSSLTPEREYKAPLGLDPNDEDPKTVMDDFRGVVRLVNRSYEEKRNDKQNEKQRERNFRVPSTSPTMSAEDTLQIQSAAVTTMHPDMYASSSPVAQKIEERNRQAYLSAAAVAMERNMIGTERKNMDMEEKPKNHSPQAASISIQEEHRLPTASDAEKNNDALSTKIPSAHAPPLSDLCDSLSNERITKAESLSRIRDERSRLKGPSSDADAQEQQHDREMPVDAARRNAAGRLQELDQKVFAEAGRSSPAIRTDRDLVNEIARKRGGPNCRTDSPGRLAVDQQAKLRGNAVEEKSVSIGEKQSKLITRTSTESDVRPQRTPPSDTGSRNGDNIPPERSTNNSVLDEPTKEQKIAREQSPAKSQATPILHLEKILSIDLPRRKRSVIKRSIDMEKQTRLEKLEVSNTSSCAVDASCAVKEANGKLTIYSWKAQDQIKPPFVWKGVTDFAWSPDGKSIAIGTEEALVFSYMPSTEVTKLINHLPSRPDILKYSPNGKFLASGQGGIDPIQLWDMSSNPGRLFRLSECQRSYSSFTFSPDSTILACWSREHTVASFWDTTFRVRAKPQSLDIAPTSNFIHGYTQSLCYMPNGRVIVASVCLTITANSYTSMICLLDAVTGAKLKEFPCFPGSKIKLSPDGSLAAAVYDPIMMNYKWCIGVWVFDMATGKINAYYETKTGNTVCQASFTRDGRLIVGCSEKKNTRITLFDAGNLLYRRIGESTLRSRQDAA